MRFILSFALLIAPAASAAGATCESLASLSLPQAAITSAQPVAPVSFGRGSIDDAANFACR